MPIDQAGVDVNIIDMARLLMTGSRSMYNESQLSGICNDSPTSPARESLTRVRHHRGTRGERRRMMGSSRLKETMKVARLLDLFPYLRPNSIRPNKCGIFFFFPRERQWIWQQHFCVDAEKDWRQKKKKKTTDGKISHDFFFAFPLALVAIHHLFITYSSRDERSLEGKGTRLLS